jgi:hypothetical protein
MITALVLYDLPAHIDREACRQHFLKIAPDFLGVPGFIRKQFIHDVNGGVAGGSCIWENLAAATSCDQALRRRRPEHAWGVSRGCSAFRKIPCLNP